MDFSLNQKTYTFIDQVLFEASYNCRGIVRTYVPLLDLYKPGSCEAALRFNSSISGPSVRRAP